MNNLQLDKKLRSLNEFEIAIKNLTDNEMIEHFSNKDSKLGSWVINQEKFFKEDEQIAIHKHDRFKYFENHSHDFFEMVYVYSGTIIHKINDKVITLKEGEVLFLDTRVSHSVETANYEDIAINIIIKRNFFHTFLLKEISEDNILSNFLINAIYGNKHIKQYLYFKCFNNTKIKDLFEKMFIEYFEKNTGYNVAIRGYMLLIFNELLRSYEKLLSKGIVKEINSLIGLGLHTYINENYKTLSLKSMAKHFNYHP